MNKYTRVGAWLMVMVLCFSLLPVGVLADDESEGTTLAEESIPDDQTIIEEIEIVVADDGNISILTEEEDPSEDESSDDSESPETETDAAETGDEVSFEDVVTNDATEATSEEQELIDCSTDFDVLDTSEEDLLATYTDELLMNDGELELQLDGASSKFYWPLDIKYSITTSYYYPDGSCHYGVDMAAPSGTPIYANFSGTAVFYQVYTEINGTKYLTSFGNCVYLTSTDGKYWAVFGHMNAFNGYSLTIPSSQTKAQSGSTDKIKIGSRTVKEGDLLGYVGTTGNSTGNHLHYGLKIDNSYVDPTGYLDQSKCAGTAPTIPDTPVISSVRAESTTSLTVKWGKVDGADYYTIKRRTEGSDETYYYVKNKSDEYTGTSYTDTGLKPGTKYWYHIYAHNSAGDSSYSQAVTGVTKCDPPTINSVTAVSSSVLKIEWSKVTGASSYIITRRLDTESSDSYVQIGTTTGTSYEDKTVKAGTKYDYHVFAVTEKGDSSERSNTKAGTTLTALTLKYNTNGGTITSDTYSATSAGLIQKNSETLTDIWDYGESKTNGLYNANTFGLTRTGYTFKGWSSSKDGSTTVFDQNDATVKAEQIYTNLKNENATVTLYAIWTPITYTVTYNANGGSGAPSAQTKTYGAALTLSSTKPTRAGYTFLGWATSSTATTATYQAGGTYTANAAATLYAVWQANQYSYSMNANGGTGSMEGFTVTSGIAFYLPENTFTRSGYTFVGWNVKRDADNKWYVTGTGWLTEEEIIAGGYTKRLYPDGEKNSINANWVSGYDGISSYTFYAVWEKDFEEPTPVTGATLTVSSTSVKPGEEAVVTVTAQDMPSLAGLSFRISYDKTKLELISAEDAGLTGWTVGIGGGEVAVWDSDKDETVNGSILTLTFKALGEAGSTAQVTLTELSAIKADETEVDFTAAAGTITINNRIPGDVNGDGKVSLADLVRMRKYLAGMDVEFDTSAGDVTGDGKVSLADLVRLRKYLAGMDVVLL